MVLCKWDVSIGCFSLFLNFLYLLWSWLWHALTWVWFFFVCGGRGSFFSGTCWDSWFCCWVLSVQLLENSWPLLLQIFLILHALSFYISLIFWIFTEFLDILFCLCLLGHFSFFFSVRYFHTVGAFERIMILSAHKNKINIAQGREILTW